jgi:hypothetical protein
MALNRQFGVFPSPNGQSYRELPATLWRSQPVGATPSDMNHLSKGGVYGTRKTGQAFLGAEDRHVAPLEGERVVA